MKVGLADGISSEGLHNLISLSLVVIAFERKMGESFPRVRIQVTGCARRTE
jgi:hypothetical protein